MANDNFKAIIDFEKELEKMSDAKLWELTGLKNENRELVVKTMLERQFGVQSYNAYCQYKQKKQIEEALKQIDDLLEKTCAGYKKIEDNKAEISKIKDEFLVVEELAKKFPRDKFGSFCVNVIEARDDYIRALIRKGVNAAAILDEIGYIDDHVFSFLFAKRRSQLDDSLKKVENDSLPTESRNKYIEVRERYYKEIEKWIVGQLDNPRVKLYLLLSYDLIKDSSMKFQSLDEALRMAETIKVDKNEFWITFWQYFHLHEEEVCVDDNLMPTSPIPITEFATAYRKLLLRYLESLLFRKEMENTNIRKGIKRDIRYCQDLINNVKLSENEDDVKTLTFK